MHSFVFHFCTRIIIKIASLNNYLNKIFLRIELLKNEEDFILLKKCYSTQ